MKVSPLEKRPSFFYFSKKKKTLLGQSLRNVSGVFTARKSLFLTPFIKLCYNLINNKSSEFITLNEKHPVRQDLGCFFCASYNTLAFVKSDTISRYHRSAFQSTSSHRLSPTRTLRATLLGQQQEE